MPIAVDGGVWALGVAAIVLLSIVVGRSVSPHEFGAFGIAFLATLIGAFGTRALEDQRQHEGELVAAVAGDGGTVGNAGFQAMSDLAKNLVTGARAEKIVDGLETVEIGDADGEGSRVLFTLLGDLANLVTQAVEIAEPGQRVGIGHGMEVSLGNIQCRMVSRLHQ